jgi:hypothetical protein|uniref:OSJNBb0089B03.13 protein n=1 Tax=Oryza sativa subsp. japonica TaxID=39947 RepID=Q7XNP8_ORYSJ|nr:OSJNBb0089B03.13 [Oryza sativa Japonica Group]
MRPPPPPLSADLASSVDLGTAASASSDVEEARGNNGVGGRWEGGELERHCDQGIKTRVYGRLMAYDTRWVQELPSVLWAIRTTLTSSNKEIVMVTDKAYCHAQKSGNLNLKQIVY